MGLSFLDVCLCVLADNQYSINSLNLYLILFYLCKIIGNKQIIIKL